MSEHNPTLPMDALTELLGDYSKSDAEALDRAAAAVLLAVTPMTETMPANLQNRILARAAVTRSD